MKKCNFLLTLLLLVAVFSCSEDKEFTVKGDSPVCLIDTSQHIEFNNLAIDARYRQARYLEVEGVPYYIGYSYKRHAFDIIDLDRGSVKESIFLLKEGPSGLNEVRGFVVDDLLNFTVLTDNAIATVSHEGVVMRKSTINRQNSEVTGLDFGKYNIYNDLMNGATIIDVGSGKFVMAVRDIAHIVDDLAYYKGDKVVVFDKNTATVSSLPIRFPDEFREDFFPANRIYNTYNGESIISGFSNSPNLLVGSLNGEESIVKKVQPASGCKRILPYKGDIYDELRLKRYFSENCEYLHLHFNPYLNQYYRFHFGVYPYDVKGNEGTRGFLHLTILDENYNLIVEKKLGTSYQYYGAVPTPEGLLLYTINGKEDVSRFTYLRLACNE